MTLLWPNTGFPRGSIHTEPKKSETKTMGELKMQQFFEAAASNCHLKFLCDKKAERKARTFYIDLLLGHEKDGKANSELAKVCFTFSDDVTMIFTLLDCPVLWCD